MPVPDVGFFVIKKGMSNARRLHRPHPFCHLYENPKPACFGRTRTQSDKGWATKHQSIFVGFREPCKRCFPEWHENQDAAKASD